MSASRRLYSLHQQDGLMQDLPIGNKGSRSGSEQKRLGRLNLDQRTHDSPEKESTPYKDEQERAAIMPTCSSLLTHRLCRMTRCRYIIRCHVDFPFSLQLQ